MKGEGRSRKRLWNEEEDRILMDFVRVHGKGKWNRAAKMTGLNRCGKSCRLRWNNYLSPSVKGGDFSQEEEDLILRLHNLLGNRWSLIAGRLPGRTDNQVKNHWNSHLSKKLRHEHGHERVKHKHLCDEVIAPSKTESAVGENPPRTAHVDTSWDWEKPTAHNNFGGSQPISTTDGGSRQAMGPDFRAEAVEMDNAWDPMRSFDNWPQPDYEDIDIYAPPLADGIERMDECFLDFILHGL
ncbi:hypothetical protein SAY86_003411 [Trapa natans]|uniref:Uncharacterized protein n=1 Tax=Trapa natans TaxID=22666 RepID=A0AAN7ME55_TRANT|nr:hypothetical protein SAY86_003411 [Trapa natans]